MHQHCDEKSHVLKWTLAENKIVHGNGLKHAHTQEKKDIVLTLALAQRTKDEKSRIRIR